MALGRGCEQHHLEVLAHRLVGGWVATSQQHAGRMRRVQVANEAGSGGNISVAGRVACWLICHNPDVWPFHPTRTQRPPHPNHAQLPISPTHSTASCTAHPPTTQMPANPQLSLLHSPLTHRTNTLSPQAPAHPMHRQPSLLHSPPTHSPEVLASVTFRYLLTPRVNCFSLLHSTAKHSGPFHPPTAQPPTQPTHSLGACTVQPASFTAHPPTAQMPAHPSHRAGACKPYISGTTHLQEVHEVWTLPHIRLEALAVGVDEGRRRAALVLMPNVQALDQRLGSSRGNRREGNQCGKSDAKARVVLGPSG